MDSCVTRSRALAPKTDNVRLPVAYLVCNTAPAVGSQPAYMKLCCVFGAWLFRSIDKKLVGTDGMRC
jgi:hypothetical protein